MSFKAWITFRAMLASRPVAMLLVAIDTSAPPGRLPEVGSSTSSVEGLLITDEAVEMVSGDVSTLNAKLQLTFDGKR